MHFQVDHTFASIALEAYEALYFAPEFNAALNASLQLQCTLELFTCTLEQIQRTTQVRPERPLPAPVAKFLGSDSFAYTEELTYWPAKRQGIWRIEPHMMANRIESGGSLAFAQASSGVTRTLTGDVKVKIFGLGTTIERLVMAEVHKSYDAAARFTETWLKEDRPVPRTVAELMG